MNFPKINLHIHSNYSDGKNSIREIVEKSINLGLNYISITDHCTNSWKADIIPSLNDKVKIRRYLNEISDIQKEFKIKAPNFGLFKGVEIDISSSYEFLSNLINPYHFDIILFEYLESFEGIAFIRNLLLYWKQKYGRKKELALLGLAHFDPSYFEYNDLGVLIKFLKENNIFFEFNSSYSQYFSRRNETFFSYLKNSEIMVSIGCDSHNLSNLNDFDGSLQMISYYELDPNFLSFINALKTRKEVLKIF